MNSKRRAANPTKNTEKSQEPNERNNWLSANMKVALATVVLFLIIMGISAFTIWPEMKNQGVAAYREGPLTKSALQIRVGDSYGYSYTTGNNSMNITYLTKQGNGCIVIFMKEIKDVGSVCIKADGTDERGTNSTLSNQLIYFFKPWMLAVNDSWKWNVKTIAIWSPTIVLDEFTLYVNSTETYHGREGYVVLIEKTGLNNSIRMVVDKEKRILLKEEGKGYVMELVSAPFPLKQPAG